MPGQSKNQKTQRRRRATTPEARENQLVALAVDLAEKQLADGTASVAVITHYLKLGSTREALERQKLEFQSELLKAQAENQRSAKQVEALYVDAIAAMKNYGGYSSGGEELL